MIRKVLFLSQASNRDRLFFLIENLSLNLGFQLVTNRNHYNDEICTRSIWIDISEVDLVIVDLPKAKDRLIYEIGLAHGLRKPVIILSKTRFYAISDVLYQNVVLYQENEEGFSKLLFQLEETLKMMNNSSDFIEGFKGPLDTGFAPIEIYGLNDNENIQTQLREILRLSGFEKGYRFEKWVSNLLEKVRDWDVTKTDIRQNKEYDFIIWNSIKDSEFGPLGNPIPVEAKATRRIEKRILENYLYSLSSQGLKGMLLVTAAEVSSRDRDAVLRIYENTGKIIVLLGINDLLKITEPADFIVQVKAKIASVLY